jgi:hypothetical protein
MRIRIGDLLVKAGVITDAQLKSALAEQSQWGGKLGDILVRMEFVTEEVLVRALSKQCGIPRADLTGDGPKAALEKVPPEMAEEFGLVPLALQDDARTLVVAMSDPLNIMVTDHLRSFTGCRVVAQIAGTQAIREAISRWYRGTSLGIDSDPASIRIINNAGGAVATTSGRPKNPIPPSSNQGLRAVVVPSPGSSAGRAPVPATLPPGSSAGRVPVPATLPPGSSAGRVPVPATLPPGSSAGRPAAVLPVTVPPSGSSLGRAAVPATLPPGSSAGRAAIPATLPPGSGAGRVAVKPSSNSGLRALPPPPPPSSSPGVMPPTVPPPAAALSAVDVLRGVEETQRRSVAALKAMVELLIEKGVFSREEYLGRVKR